MSLTINSQSKFAPYYWFLKMKKILSNTWNFLQNRGISGMLRRLITVIKNYSSATAGSCFSGKRSENQGLWEFEEGFLYQI